jgi:hypothetical protein
VASPGPSLVTAGRGAQNGTDYGKIKLMPRDYRNLVAVSLAALGAALFLLTLGDSLSATANLVLRLAALALGFGAFIYTMFSGRHVP